MYRWEREDFKRISEATTKARAALPFTHRGGTATFLRHKRKKKEEGTEISEIDLFQITHSNEKKGWVNEAKTKYDEMMALKTASSQEGSEPLLDKEICEQVLGKRPGHVKVLGWVPRPRNARNEASYQTAKETKAEIAHLQRLLHRNKLQLKKF